MQINRKQNYHSIFRKGFSLHSMVHNLSCTIRKEKTSAYSINDLQLFFKVHKLQLNSLMSLHQTAKIISPQFAFYIISYIVQFQKLFIPPPWKGFFLYTPHPSGNSSQASYIYLNFQAFENPLPQGISNPFCGGNMDIFWNQSAVRGLTYLYRTVSVTPQTKNTPQQFFCP